MSIMIITTISGRHRRKMRRASGGKPGAILENSSRSLWLCRTVVTAKLLFKLLLSKNFLWKIYFQLVFENLNRMTSCCCNVLLAKSRKVSIRRTTLARAMRDGTRGEASTIADGERDSGIIGEDAKDAGDAQGRVGQRNGESRRETGWETAAGEKWREKSSPTRARTEAPARRSRAHRRVDTARMREASSSMLIRRHPRPANRQLTDIRQLDASIIQA